MSMLVRWSKPVYNEFLNIAILTEEEEKMIEAHVLKHWSRTQKEMYFNMSETKVDDVMYSLKVKYWDAARYSEILRDAWIAPPLKERKSKKI